MATSRWKSGLPAPSTSTGIASGVGTNTVPSRAPREAWQAGREGGQGGASREEEGLAAGGWLGGGPGREGLAPFLSLMETTSLMSKGNNLS